MTPEILTPILLPTEDASILVKLEDVHIVPIDHKLSEFWNFHHLYLTSESPIKEGDWCFDEKLNRVYKATKVVQNNKEQLEYPIFKIEFTTDPKLWDVELPSGLHTGGIPSIDENTKAFSSDVKIGDKFILDGKEYKLANVEDAEWIYKGKKQLNHLWNLSEKFGSYDEVVMNWKKEVPFLTEFCKRWNENDKQSKVKIKFCKGESMGGHCCYPDKSCNKNCEIENQKSNQKVDIKQLASDMACDESEYRGFIEGFKACQALQAQAGDFSLEDVKEIYKAGNCQESFYEDKFQDIIQSLTKSSSSSPSGSLTIDLVEGVLTFK